MRVQSQFIEMFDNTSKEMLGKFIQVIRGVSYKPSDVKTADDSDTAVILRSNNICDANLNIDEVVYIDKNRVSEDQYLRVNDMVVCASNGSKALVGKAAINKSLINRYAHGAFCLLIRPKDNINPVYLNTFFQTSLYKNQIDELAAGSNILNIKQEHLANMILPLPIIEKQNKFAIIAKQADKSKFVGFKSQFIEMFGGVEKKPFVDVCINKGEYGSNSPADDYDGKIRYVRITDITEEGNLNSVVVSPRKVEEKYMLLRDDLLFARTGNTVGKTYLHKSGKMIFAGYLIRYRLNKKLMLPQFAFAYTHTNQYYDWVEKIKKVGAQPNISAAQYDSMPIPIPSMAKQVEFMSIAKQADKSKYYN